MKKIIFWICISFLLWLSNASAFTDIENSWYKNSILELKEAGLVNGYGDGRFWPDDNVTRAEILAIILNAAEVDLPEVWDEKCFPDVGLDTWYAPYVCYAAEREITSWYEDGSFRPNGSVSIIEALAFTTLVFELDVEREAEVWYEDFITFADAENIIPKNAYSVDSLWKRGQIADIIVWSQDIFEWDDSDYKSIWCGVNSSLDDENTIVINGKDRKYLLELPKNYQNSEEYPLVFGLHGRTNNNEMVKDYMNLMGGRWVGDREIITAYPAWLGSGPYTWHEAESIDFFDAMVLEISENLCVDRSEVHIVGHSLWSYFSNKLSCLRWDVINTMTGVASAWYDKECRGPVASLIMHNAADHLVPFTDWVNATKIRREKNQCSWEAKEKNIWGLNCEVWDECSAWNPVAFCTEYPTYWNDPHSWPTDRAKGIFEFIEMKK